MEISMEDKFKRVIKVPERIWEILAVDRNLTEKSLTEIADVAEFRDHFQIIDESLGWIKEVGIIRRHITDKELIIKGVTARIYNDAASALSLMLSGLQQVSLMPQRDILECSLLLQKFALDRDSILRWKQDSESNEFRAGNVRKYIEKHGGNFPKDYIKGMWFLFDKLSTRGVHPNYQGIATMLTKENDSTHKLCPGPFFDFEKLRISISIFAPMVVFAAYSVVYSLGLDSLNRELKLAYEKFQENVDCWMAKYESIIEPKP